MRALVRLEGAAVSRCMWLVIGAGALLNLAVIAATVYPELRPLYLGGEDGVRWRLLRLACVASLALPTLTLLYERLVARREPRHSLVLLGRAALVLGAFLMPTILATAGLTSLQVKYLLPLPATAVLVGTSIALACARRAGGWCERCGWLLIVASISAGMFMGLYAFDGPLPAPAVLGQYNDLGRTWVRDAHACAILVGMLALCIAARRPASATSALPVQRAPR